VTATNSTDCSITGGTLHVNKANNTDSGAYTAQCAVFANLITRFKLTDVTVQNAVYSGVFLRNDTESVIEGCYFLNNGKMGVTGGVIGGVMIDGPSNSTFSTGTKVKTHMLRATSIGFCTGAYIRYVTFNSSTATGNATGFGLESEVFANEAYTQANSCISWSNTDRGFYLGVQESLSLVAKQSVKQLEYT
jgi:hypothetical protein